MNNRELASAVWIGVLVVSSLVSSRTRSAVLGLVRAALHPKVVLPVLLMLALVLLLVWAAASVGLWVGGLFVPTLAWVVAVGLVLLFNFEHTWKTPRFLRSTASKVLGIGVFIGFFTNLFPLSLLGEMILQPTVVFLTLIALVARRDPAHRPVERLAEVFLVAIGIALITFSAVQLIGQWDTLDLRLLSLEFLLPVWLTAGVLPFVYAMAIYGAYETAFLRINHAVDGRRGRVRAKLAALLTCRLNLRDADALSFYWARQAGETTSLSGARQVLRELRRSRREADHEQEEARVRLVRNAGLQGTGDDGRQLDQREFEETKRGLRWLATCQMGWYRNRGGRYRTDLLDIVGDFTNYGLPVDHGVELHVAPDGQRWWAGRRTITGWYFAIGAAGPPPDQWEYDDEAPPGGFPGEHPDWGERPFSFEACANW